MGAWGTGIFQDDTASDIREDYKNHLGNGLSGPEATARILAEYKSSLDDPHEAPVVAGLPRPAQKHGRLWNPETLAHALQVIDSGSDLRRWESNAGDFAKRRAVLEKLRVQITSPQPEAKKVRKQVITTCGWPVGALIAYRMNSGNLAIIHVIGYHTDKGGTNPVCELLDWTGTIIPTEEMLRTAGLKESNPADRHKIRRFMIFRLDKKAAKRIERLEFTLEPLQERVPPISAILWKQRDEFLKRWFLMEWEKSRVQSRHLHNHPLKHAGRQQATHDQRHPRIFANRVTQLRSWCVEDAGDQIGDHLRIGSVLCALDQYGCASVRRVPHWSIADPASWRSLSHCASICRSQTSRVRPALP